MSSMEDWRPDELRELSQSEERTYTPHDVESAIYAIRAVAYCVAESRSNWFAVETTNERMMDKLVDLIGRVGTHDASVISGPWSDFMRLAHQALMGRDHEWRQAIVAAALWGDSSLGIPKIEETTNGLVLLRQNDKGQIYLEIDTSRPLHEFEIPPVYSPHHAT